MHRYLQVWLGCDPAAQVQLATHNDVDEAIDAAVATAPAMAALGAYERKSILEKVSLCMDGGLRLYGSSSKQINTSKN